MGAAGPPEPTDTALIVGRIEASERNTERIFDAHEQRDQDRFEAITHELGEHRDELKTTIDGLTRQVERTNGGLTRVTADMDSVKRDLAVTQAEEARKRERQARRLGWAQKTASGAAGAAATVATYFLAKHLGWA